MKLAEKTAKAMAIAICAAPLILMTACSKDKDAAGGPGGPVTVAVKEIQPQKINFTKELAGRVYAFQISEVRPQVNGILQKRLFEEGADVKAGDILYKIDPSMYKANYDAAKAQLTRAEANVPATQFKLRRHSNLVKENAVSRQEYESSDAAYKQALADVAVAKASLESARINLAYTDVKSPISGRIGRSAVTPGALMSVGQPNAMVTVQQLDPVYVDVTQSTLELLRLRKIIESGRLRKPENDGASLRLILEDGAEYSEKGTLQFTDVSVDQTTGSVTLRAIFPNPGHILLPGMYVRIILEEGLDEQAMMVPQTALMRDARGNASVYVVNEKNIVEMRPVKAARTRGADWVVADGLNKGDKIVIEGLQFVHPGSAVAIRTGNSEADGGAVKQARSAEKNAEAPTKSQVN